MLCGDLLLMFFFFKQKTAYDMRISDWSSDVCSSDLGVVGEEARTGRRQLVAADQPRGEAVAVLGRCKHWRGWRRAHRETRRRFAYRSEERRVGKEGVSTCSSRWSRYH